MVCVFDTEQRVLGPEAGFIENAYKLTGVIKGCVISALGRQLSVFHDGMLCCLNLFLFLYSLQQTAFDEHVC